MNSSVNRSPLAVLSLAPLLGASQTLLHAATMTALSVVAIVVHRALMTPLRRQLDASCAVIASALLAAAGVTCQTLARRAWAQAPTACTLVPDRSRAPSARATASTTSS